MDSNRVECFTVILNYVILKKENQFNSKAMKPCYLSPFYLSKVIITPHIIIASFSLTFHLLYPSCFLK